MWWWRQNNSLHRRPGGDPEDSRSPEEQKRTVRALYVTREPGAARRSIRLTSVPPVRHRMPPPEVHGRVAAGLPLGMGTAQRQLLLAGACYGERGKKHDRLSIIDLTVRESPADHSSRP